MSLILEARGAFAPGFSKSNMDDCRRLSTLPKSSADTARPLLELSTINWGIRLVMECTVLFRDLWVCGRCGVYQSEMVLFTAHASSPGPRPETQSYSNSIKRTSRRVQIPIDQISKISFLPACSECLANFLKMSALLYDRHQPHKFSRHSQQSRKPYEQSHSSCLPDHHSDSPVTALHSDKSEHSPWASSKSVIGGIYSKNSVLH